MDKKKLVNFWLGPLFLAGFILLNPLAEPMSSKVCGVIAWMLIWWISESVPMAVTALLPLVLFPLLGVMKIEEVSSSYGNRFVFLFLGGFIIALAMEKWQLHRRIALNIVNLTGVSANRIILGFFAASYLISMWISNTATALMMFPIAISVVNLVLTRNTQLDEKGSGNFALVIMLCIAYGSSIGGIATLVGTPPNAAMAAILGNETFQRNITFMQWFQVGFPFSLVLFFVSYFLLIKVIYPNKLGKFEMGHQVIKHELGILGKWKTEEKKIFLVFIGTALMWISLDYISPLLQSIHLELTDAAVAITAGIILFILPGKGVTSAPILEWKDSEKLPWGILLMFGGGLALAEGFKVSGLVDRIADSLGFIDQSNVFLFAVILCGIGLILTALMSNLAMVNIFVPVVAVLAIGIGKTPESFAIPVTIAASCDFMFPMSTPPNAIAYSSGYVKATQMFRAGIVLNLVSFFLLAGMIWILFRL